MTANKVTASIKLCIDPLLLDTIILCNFGSLIMSGFEATEGGPPKLPSPVAGGEKKPGLNKVFRTFFNLKIRE